MALGDISVRPSRDFATLAGLSDTKRLGPSVTSTASMAGVMMAFEERGIPFAFHPANPGNPESRASLTPLCSFDRLLMDEKLRTAVCEDGFYQFEGFGAELLNRPTHLQQQKQAAARIQAIQSRHP